MAKKGLAALASKQINSTAQPSAPAPVSTPHEATDPVAAMAEMSEIYGRENTLNVMEISKEKEEEFKRKVGRPAAITAPDEVNVTFKISKALFQEIRVKAVMENTTQKEIVTAALRQYLNK